MRRGVVFLAWGEMHVREVAACITASEPLRGYDIVLVTDQDSDASGVDARVIRVDFCNAGHGRKAELYDVLPEGYDSWLFLDSDTIVLGDVSLGFEKAEAHGIAMAHAPAYELANFLGFERVMQSEGVEARGQAQYNSGVIFFRRGPDIAAVMARWRELVEAYWSVVQADQPFLSLALEQCGLNAYALSRSFNYRGMGELLHGDVRIWHHHEPPPAGIGMRIAGGEVVGAVPEFVFRYPHRYEVRDLHAPGLEPRH